MVNTDGLKALAGRRKAKGVEPWRPPTVDDFAWGEVLTFDPSLGATGFLWLSRNSHGLGVRDGQTLKTTSTEGKGGHAENLARARGLYRAFRTLLSGFYPSQGEVVVVHESPPDGGGRIRRPESALLASLALEIATEDLGFTLAPPVAVATHRKLVCGRVRGVDKKEEHRVLRTWAPDLIDGYDRHVTNEAKRDALCVGLAHLHRKE